MSARKLSALALACLLLMLSACGHGETAAEATPSPTPTPTATVTASPSPSPSATPRPTVVPSASPTPTPTPTPPESVLRPEEGTLSDGTHATLVYQTLSDSPLVAMSFYLADGCKQDADALRYACASSAYLEFGYVAGKSPSELMPAFIDDYIDYTDAEFSSYATVGEEKRRCNTVTASNGAADAQAWLIETDGGTLTVLLYCGKSAEDDFRDLLDGMVATLVVHDA